MGNLQKFLHQVARATGHSYQEACQLASALNLICKPLIRMDILAILRRKRARPLGWEALAAANGSVIWQ
jgi:hypothetical protein